MRYMLLTFATLITTSCASVSVNKTTFDGDKQTDCEARYTSLFLSVDANQMAACGMKSNTAGSTVNTQLIEQLLKTAASLATP